MVVASDAESGDRPKPTSKKCIEVEDANNSSVFLDSVQDVMVEEKTEIGHPVEMLTAIDHDARHKSFPYFCKSSLTYPLTFVILLWC